MKVNWRWTTVLAIIALSLLAWFYNINSKNNEELKTHIQDENGPTYVGDEMQTTLYSLDGQVQYTATAKNVVYFQNDGRSEFEQPIVYLYEPAQPQSSTLIKSWKISANKATLLKNKTLKLSGNVAILSLLPDSKIERLDTQKLTLNLTSGDISSDTLVTITGPSFTTYGEKLEGNLHDQTATLKEQVKTKYEANNR